jgi:hypothetical protein
MRTCLILLLALLGSVMAFELVITEEELQNAIEEGIVDPNVTFVEVDIATGVIHFTGIRTRPATGIEDVLTMDIYLEVGDDHHIEISVEDAMINGFGIDEGRLEIWNDRIARGIERFTGSQQGMLQRVTVGSNEIALTWE